MTSTADAEAVKKKTMVRTEVLRTHDFLCRDLRSYQQGGAGELAPHSVGGMPGRPPCGHTVPHTTPKGEPGVDSPITKEPTPVKL